MAVWGCAKWNWEPQGDNELAVRAGDRVEVLDADDDAWWHCRHDSSGEGWLPCTHLVVVVDEASAAEPPPATKTDPEVLREYLSMLDGPADEFSEEDLQAVCDEEGVVYQPGASKAALVEALRNYLLAQLGEPPSWARVGPSATSPAAETSVGPAIAAADDAEKNEYREMIGKYTARSPSRMILSACLCLQRAWTRTTRGRFASRRALSRRQGLASCSCSNCCWCTSASSPSPSPSPSRSPSRSSRSPGRPCRRRFRRARPSRRLFRLSRRMIC